jgi:hypothetical protein
VGGKKLLRLSNQQEKGSTAAKQVWRLYPANTSREQADSIIDFAITLDSTNASAEHSYAVINFAVFTKPADTLTQKANAIVNISIAIYPPDTFSG